MYNYILAFKQKIKNNTTIWGFMKNPSIFMSSNRTLGGTFMKKKLFTLFLIFSLALSFIACGSFRSSDQGPYTISVKKGLFNTKIFIPTAFATSADIEDSSQDSFEIATIAKEQGIKNVTTNDDGSVSMKMSNNTYKNFLTSVKIAIDDYNSEFIKDNTDTCSFREISHDINLTEFNVKIDSEEYVNSDILSSKPLYFFGILYQSLSGTSKDDIKTTVNILDKDTENLIHTDNLTLDEYIDILGGVTELSTEEQEPVTTTASTSTATTTSTASDSTTASAQSTKQATTETTTTAASTQATTATTATTAATTAASTPNLNTADQSKTTAAASTQATTAATTTAQNRDLPAGNYSDTGSGSISLSNQDGGAPTITGNPNSTVDIILKTENFDTTHTSYIYIDGILAATAQLESEQGLRLQGHYLTTGTHKVEVIQYNNNNPSGSIITYKSASYQVKAQ